MHLGDDIVGVLHVQEGLLHAGERGVVTIFGVGRRADGDESVLAELGVLAPDCLDEPLGERFVHHPGTDELGGLVERVGVAGIQLSEETVDPLGERLGGVLSNSVVHVVEVCRDGRREATRHVGTGAHQLAEAGRLATDLIDILHADAAKRQRVPKRRSGGSRGAFGRLLPRGGLLRRGALGRCFLFDVIGHDEDLFHRSRAVS